MICMSVFLQCSKFRFLTVLNVMAEGELLSYSFFFFFLASRSEVRKNIFLAVSLKLRELTGMSLHYMDAFVSSTVNTNNNSHCLSVIQILHI